VDHINCRCNVYHKKITYLTGLDYKIQIVCHPPKYEFLTQVITFQRHTLNIAILNSSNDIIQQCNTHNIRKHNRSQIIQINFLIWFFYESPDFFICSELNQIFSNIFKSSYQRSLQLSWSFSITLIKYLEQLLA